MPKVIIKLSRRAEFRANSKNSRLRNVRVLYAYSITTSPPSSLVSSSNSLIYRAFKSRKNERERETNKEKWREEGRRVREEISHGSNRQRNRIVGRLVIIPCTVNSWRYSWRLDGTRMPVVQHVKRKHVRCTKILSSVGATVETLPACSRRKSALGRRNSKHTSPSSRPVHRHPVCTASFCVDEPCSNCESSLFFSGCLFWLSR